MCLLIVGAGSLAEQHPGVSCLPTWPLWASSFMQQRERSVSPASTGLTDQLGKHGGLALVHYNNV